MNVLIIDDEVEIIESLVEILEDDGHSLRSASNGEVGLKEFSQGSFDMVMLDIKLGKDNGIDILRHIVKNNSEMLVIMMTGHGSVALASEAFKCGAYDFLEKPLRLTQVRAAIRNVSQHITYQNQKEEEARVAKQKICEMEQQLLLSDKMASLGNLVAGVAHEVNNPIGALASASNTMQRCMEKIEQKVATNNEACQESFHENFGRFFKLLQDNNRVVSTACERVTAIVQNLKDFSRLDESERQKVDIHQGLESTLLLMKHHIKNRISVTSSYESTSEILCFPRELNQVFMNILINASQAIDNKGEIDIRTRSDDRNIFISISDSGSGIPNENIKHLFEPGFTTKGVGVGTGLGLSICYAIIKKHDGFMWVESEVGKGTTFNISLPLIVE